MSFSVSATAFLTAAAALDETSAGFESSPPFPAAARSARDSVDSLRMSPNRVGERHAGDPDASPLRREARCSRRSSRVARPCAVTSDAKPPNPRVHARDALAASDRARMTFLAATPRQYPTSPVHAGVDDAGPNARDASDPTRRSALDKEDIARERCPAATCQLLRRD